MTVVNFDRRGDMYAITFTYDALVVEMLKAVVPSYSRTYSPPRREWLIEAVYGKPLSDAMTKLGCMIIGIEPEPDDDTDWAKILFRRVGPNRADAVFRALTKVLHPDNAATGSTELQRQLIAARVELKAA